MNRTQIDADFSGCNIPQGWVWRTLGETCEIVPGQSPPSRTFNAAGLGLPFYQGKAEFGRLYPSPARWCSEPQKVAQAGDVLISLRAPVGPTNLCREKSCIGRGLAAVRPLNGMCSRYLLYFLRHVERDWANRTTGTTFAAISARVLRDQPIPLPPPTEQRRIVAAIERHLARLDAGVTALERVQARLARYRAAVLKGAWGGGIDEGPKTKDEGGMHCAGTEWVTLGQVVERIEAGRSPRTQGRPARRGEFGVLKVSAVSWGRFLAQENKALLPGDAPGDTPTVRAGDLLISRANTAELVGAVVLVERDHPHLMLSDKTLRLVPTSGVLREYLLHALRAPQVRDFFACQASGTSRSMRNLSQAKLRATPIPLPPLAVQRRIVREVERRFSAVATLEEAVASSLTQAERVRRAILKRAFMGGLRD
jgi:type I restriction enzyme S subunit